MTVCFPHQLPVCRVVAEPVEFGAARYILGAFMTPDYAHFGERLLSSCRAHSLPLALLEVPSVHRSISPRGSPDLCYTKANVVSFLLNRYRRPILYLDSDCVVVQRPDRVDRLLAEGVDFAVFNWLAEEHTEAYVPFELALRQGQQTRMSGKRFYCFHHSIDYLSHTQLLCSGAVQFYNTTEPARRLLTQWQQAIEQFPLSADDHCLDFAFNNYPQDAPPLKANWWDKSYARCAWWIYVRPVIDHPQIPGKEERFVRIDQLDGKRQYYFEQLQRKTIQPVFPKDCLIDTQTGWLLRHRNGNLDPVRQITVPLWLSTTEDHPQGSQ